MRIPRIILIFLAAFIGVGALVGGILMLIDPAGRLLGMNFLLPYFHVLPLSELLFQDYIVPGIALILLNGFTNAANLVILLKKSVLSGFASIICGVILMLWIMLQLYILPLNPISPIFFVLGMLQVIFGVLIKTSIYTIKNPPFSGFLNDVK